MLADALADAVPDQYVVGAEYASIGPLLMGGRPHARRGNESFAVYPPHQAEPASRLFL